MIHLTTDLELKLGLDYLNCEKNLNLAICASIYILKLM